MRKFAISLLTASLAVTPLCADFSYRETTQITGGALYGMMKFAGAFAHSGQKPTDPQDITVAFKGNRMVSKSAQHISITDLDKQTITTVDLIKKTYSVMTFQQFRDAMQQMSEKMSKNSDAQNVQVNVKVVDTGKTKTLDGMSTREAQLTFGVSGTDPQSGQSGTMTETDDAWLATSVDGYQQVTDFHKRMAEAMGFAMGPNPMLNRPDIAKAMAELYKEGGKMNGVPLISTIQIGAAGHPAAAETPAQQQDSGVPPTSLSGALAGAFGSHFGKHKNDDNRAQCNCLLEMSLHATNFSSATVEDEMFALPAGLKQVEPDLARMHQQ